MQVYWAGAVGRLITLSIFVCGGEWVRLWVIRKDVVESHGTDSQSGCQSVGGCRLVLSEPEPELLRDMSRDSYADAGNVRL